MGILYIYANVPGLQPFQSARTDKGYKVRERVTEMEMERLEIKTGRKDGGNVIRGKDTKKRAE